jgi:hypothetical protein
MENPKKDLDIKKSKLIKIIILSWKNFTQIVTFLPFLMVMGIA